MSGKTPPYVPGFTLLMKKERIRRPCGGVLSACCSVLSTLRTVLSAHVSRDVQNSDLCSGNRHRRRATGSSYPLVLSHFSHTRVGNNPPFSDIFSLCGTGITSPPRAVTPWFKAGLGQFLTFLHIPDFPENVGVSARFCRFCQLHRGLPWGWDRFLAGISGNNGELMSKTPYKTPREEPILPITVRKMRITRWAGISQVYQECSRPMGIYRGFCSTPHGNNGVSALKPEIKRE